MKIYDIDIKTPIKKEKKEVENRSGINLMGHGACRQRQGEATSNLQCCSLQKTRGQRA